MGTGQRLTTNIKQSSMRWSQIQPDQVMVGVLWLLWPVSLGFASLYGNLLLWAVAGTMISGLGTLVWRFNPGTLLTRLTMAVCFMSYAALLIDQSQGMTETHFAIFSLLAFLLYYRDWRPIILAAGLIAVHHAVFYFLQADGFPVFVFDHPHMFNMVLVHAAYVVSEMCVLVLMSIKLREETNEAAILASLGTNNSVSGEIDLDPIRIAGAGEAGAGVATFLDTISHALREASAVAITIRQASHKLSSASGGMVNLRNQQQLDIDQVVDLVREMDGVADHVAHESQRIADEAQQCSQTAQETGENMTLTTRSIEELVVAVQQTAQQMTELDQATARIESIVTMIDDIAGQTNLLALNASIEAARAGDAGRGFAVVAGEVRRLSESTQSSAKQIQEVVNSLRSAALNAKGVAETSRAEAERGGERMRLAGEAFQDIVARFPLFASGMNSLSSAMGRQQSLMRETNKHMSDISHFVQESSTRVEDITSSGLSLESMSERLCDSVRCFRKGSERFVA